MMDSLLLEKSSPNPSASGLKTYYIESYGCAMNFSDSEVVASILESQGFTSTPMMSEADLVMLNTCSIREKAEQTVRNRLTEIRGKKGKKKGALVAVLGCMAERLKSKLLDEEKIVDIVVGPDAYKSLPELIEEAQNGQKAVNVILSREETYAEIMPTRLDSDGISAFVSIMRGCNNMCSFCVVPFTRGRERSRPVESILQECQNISDLGYKEITLLGQNVDSYHFESPNQNVNFAKLLEIIASSFSHIRLRFSTSHPKDITDEVLYTMKKYDNICKSIHFPLQSGSTRVLQLMNRTYTREWFESKLARIRELIPDCAISTDIITGFCTETEEDHVETLDVMRNSRFDMAYMYFYSERPGTLAARQLKDDVPLEVKKSRLTEVIELKNEIAAELHRELHGKTYDVLLEGPTKKSENKWYGRNSQNNVIIIENTKQNFAKGDYVKARITDSTNATLFGELV